MNHPSHRADPRPAQLDRRDFLRVAAGLTLAGTVPESLLADPYAPRTRALPSAFRSAALDPVRVRGRVVAARRGLAGVGISDGRDVIQTDREGRFELLTNADRSFVSCSLPSGHRIPTNPTGTARLYRSLTPNTAGEMDALFELEQLDQSDERHTMLLLPDIQTENARDMDHFHADSVPDVQATVSSMGDRHAFGIACGDIMWDDLSMYPEYERGVERMAIPFFQVVGNHDLDFDGAVDEATTRSFTRHFGPRYYSFDRGAVHYVILDDVFYFGTGYLGYLDRDQLAWLEADLSGVEPGRPVIVALHIPVLGTRHLREGQPQPNPTLSVNNREALYRLLEPYRAHVLSGHTHENDHHFAHGVHEHVSGTVCGGWWTGPICADGTPNGYSVYEVEGEEVTWRYKAVGEPDGHQVRAFLPAADPSAPQEMIANVWNADDSWSVVWYEDGERKGRMARRVGRDPMSLVVHAGDELPPRRPWVDPFPRYLFYAPVSSAAREVRVEATDRFGRTYTAFAQPVPVDLVRAAWSTNG